MAIEAEHYQQNRERLAQDPVVRAMAEGVRGVPLDQLAHDGPGLNPRYEFMLAALREYEKRAGHPAECHIGGVAEAILMILGEGR